MARTQTNIHRKLQNMRAALKEKSFSSFSELVDIVAKKAKDYKLLPLYSYMDGMATLTVVDMDDINSKVVFRIPADLVTLKTAKEHLYGMAFDVEINNDTITPHQYITLSNTMKEKGVAEEEILERYKIKSLPDMTQDIFKRCMNALNKS